MKKLAGHQVRISLRLPTRLAERLKRTADKLEISLQALIVSRMLKGFDVENWVTKDRTEENVMDIVKWAESTPGHRELLVMIERQTTGNIIELE